jgi:excinuclease ABC subunit A
MSAPLSRSVFNDACAASRTPRRSLYLIEEPSIGLHMADAKRLIDILHRLVDEGHTVAVIEHHLDDFGETVSLLMISREGSTNGFIC